MRLINLNIVLSVFMSLIAPNAMQLRPMTAPTAIIYDIENSTGDKQSLVSGWDIRAEKYGVTLDKTSGIKGLIVESKNGFELSTDLVETQDTLTINLDMFVKSEESKRFTVSTLSGQTVVASETFVVESSKRITKTLTLKGTNATTLAVSSEDDLDVVIASVSVAETEVENSDFGKSMIIPNWVNSGDLVSTTYQEGHQVIYLNDAVATQVLAKTQPIAIENESLSDFEISYELEILKQTHSVEIGVRFLDKNKKQVKYKNELIRNQAGAGTITKTLTEVDVKDATHFEIIVSSGGVSNTEVFIKSVGAKQFVKDLPSEVVHETIYNPGLELDATKPLGWTKVTTGGVVEVRQDVKLSGASSLYLLDTVTEGDLDVSAPRVMSDKMVVTPGDDLTISSNVYAIQQTHNIVLEAYFYNEAGTQVGHKQELFSSNSLGVKKWSKMNLVTRVPEGASAMKIAFYSGQPSITEAHFDDISVTVMPKDVSLDRTYLNPEKLGPMVDVSLGQASAIGVNPNGELEVYFHSNGLPGTFSVLDGVTGELKFSKIAEGTEAVWGMVIGLDGTVYFASTGDGSLFAYDPVKQELKVVGVNPTDKWTWDLEVAEDGKIYGSTYPNAGVWEYDPQTGQFKDYGAIVTDAAYVRGIAVEGDYIYAATGTVRHLIKINRHTGEKREIVIEGHTGTNGFFEDLRITDDYFFLSSGSVNMLVVNRETLEVVDTFHYNNNISKEDPNNPNEYYFKSVQKLYKYNTDTLVKTEIELNALLPDTARVKDFVWLGDELAFITAYGEYMFYNPQTGKLRFQTLDIVAQPVAIQALEAGFDGKLYLGGYQRGMSIYNPFTGEKEVNLSSFAQPEGIGFMNDKVYYGTYVAAIMYSMDPSKPITLGDNPTMMHAIGDHQDRPFAITSGGNKLYVGTVPDYGVVGGVLAIYDETTDSWYQERNVVEDQSIIALEYHNGLLYGGTSIWGGLDAKLTQDEAKLFIWDTTTNTKVKEMTLDIPGIDEDPKMIGGLSVGPDGLLWGIVDGTIFAMDLETHEIVKSKMIQPSKYNSSKWFPYRIQWGPDGTIYTTLSRQLIAIDTETLQYQVIVSDFMNNMTVNIDGTIFYALGNELYQIRVPETDATLSDISIAGKSVTNFSPGELSYTVSNMDVSSLKAVTSQTGATTTITVDESNKVVEISVLATDNKSTLTYSVKYGTITVSSDNGINIDATINNEAFEGDVDKVVISNPSYFESLEDTVLENVEAILKAKGETVENYLAFSITPLDKDGNPLQLRAGETQEFTMDIPKGFSIEGSFSIFHINKDGSVDELEYSIKDGKITFVVESFSDFVIVEKKAITHVPQKPGTPNTTLPQTGVGSFNPVSIIALGVLLVVIDLKKKRRA